MALKQSLEKNGLFLFRYRGQIPVFIFLLGLPFIFFRYYTKIFWVFALMLEGNVELFFNILTVVGIMVSFAGLCIRAYTIGTTPRGTSGRNTKEQVANELNSTGMYSMVRHPLYLGNYLMWAGLLIFIGSLPLFIIISLLYWIYYERIMYAEECFLEKQFGEKYTEWSMTVPPFLPKIATALCFVIIDYIRAYGISMVMDYDFEWVRTSLYCLIVAGVITITLRSLKHYTKVLSDDNRD